MSMDYAEQKVIVVTDRMQLSYQCKLFEGVDVRCKCVYELHVTNGTVKTYR